MRIHTHTTMIHCILLRVLAGTTPNMKAITGRSKQRNLYQVNFLPNTFLCMFVPSADMFRRSPSRQMSPNNPRPRERARGGGFRYHCYLLFTIFVLTKQNFHVILMLDYNIFWQKEN